MKLRGKPFTAKYLRSILRYEPLSGYWFWLNPPYKNIKPGTETGKPRTSGRRTITIKGEIYQTSRLAFLYMTGRWPKYFMGHRDRNPVNEKWDNLREATHAQNMANAKRSYWPGHKSGIKGVHPHGKKFKAICGGMYLGIFATKEDAARAYLTAAKMKYGKFAHAG